MATVLDRVQKLLALAASPNANEARNAAFLAAKLIREHGLQLVEPATRRPSPIPRKTPPSRKQTPARKVSSKRGARAVTDAPKPITSPLGGDCVVCARRYKAGSEVLWSDADGGMHPECLDNWVRKKR